MRTLFMPLFSPISQKWMLTIVIMCALSLLCMPQVLASTDTSPEPHNIEHAGLFIKTYDQAMTTVNYQNTPVEHTAVSIEVTGMVARTTITQQFFYAGEYTADAMYAFPVPNGAAIDTLDITIGDSRITGIIQAKQQAQKAFKQAINSGKKAGLMVMINPNMFTQTIGNIGPGEYVSVTFAYQQSLPFVDEAYQLNIPLGLNGTTDQYMTYDINVYTGMSDVQFGSDSHRLLVYEQDEGDYLIDINDHSHQANLHLSWQLPTGQEPHIAHFAQTIQDHVYGLVQIIPNAVSVPMEQRNMVFVIDSSASMYGAAMDQAKHALQKAIQTLSTNDRFNIIDFDSQSRALWTNPQWASEQNKALASQFIENLAADGGTNMTAALTGALAMSHFAMPLTQVIFITDGYVNNEMSLMDTVIKHLGDKKLFTISVSHAPNAHFMQEIAKLGKGTFRQILDEQDIVTQLDKLFAELSRPSLIDLELAFIDTQGTVIARNAIESYPDVLPDVYHGRPIDVVYQHAANTPPIAFIQLSGHYWQEGQKQQWAQRFAVESVQSSTIAHHAVGLNKLWAKRKIDNLRVGRYFSSALAIPGFEQILVDAITKVALDAQILSEYTSMVAVDDRVTARKREGGTLLKTHYGMPQLWLSVIVSSLVLLLGWALQYFTVLKGRNNVKAG